MKELTETAFNEWTICHDMSSNNLSATSFPRVPSINIRKLCTVHLPPWTELYSSFKNMDNNSCIQCFSKVIQDDLWIDMICCYVLTPCFCIETFVRCTNMLSSSFKLALYLTVQNRQKPGRNLQWNTQLLSISGHIYVILKKNRL